LGDSRLLRQFRRLKKRLPKGFKGDMVDGWFVTVDYSNHSLSYAVPYVPVQNKRRYLYAWSPCVSGRVQGTPYWTNGAVMVMTRQFESENDTAVRASDKDMARFIIGDPVVKMTMFFDLEIAANPIVEVCSDSLACFVDGRYLDVAFTLFGTTTAYLNKSGNAVILRENNLSLMLIVGMTLDGAKPMRSLYRLRRGLRGAIRGT